MKRVLIVGGGDAGKKLIKKIINKIKLAPCKISILSKPKYSYNNEVKIDNIRDIEIEDLLCRDAILIDKAQVGNFLKEKTILVTGGGGSIGSELVRQIAQFMPHKLIIFDIYENGVYNIQQEMKRKYPNLRLETIIGSICDENYVRYIFNKYRPDIIYHAAAHKHVPLMESVPCEAIRNNVFGTYNCVKAAVDFDAKQFILISTDKAVKPIGIMGASKRLCEMIIKAMNEQGNTEFLTVRFGNVLDSNGSVIPLFRQQIKEGGPVTVTHPEITRFFMTISEAVSLVLQSSTYSKGGEIFVLDMGDPVKIDDLARNLIELSGYIPDVDIKIEYTGLRPGEKLYEEIFTESEIIGKTENNLIFLGKQDEIPENFFEILKNLEEAANSNAENMIDLVADAVDTYKPNRDNIIFNAGISKYSDTDKI